MTDTLFDALLNLYMCDDPTVLSPEQNSAVVAALNEQARERGFDDWSVALHEFKPNNLVERN